MNNFRCSAALVLAIFLAGCALLPTGSPPPLPAPAPAPAPAPKPIATRSFLLPGQEPKGFRVHGYILFNSRPTTVAHHQRYAAACDAFVGVLNPTGDYSNSYDLLPTYWPISGSLSRGGCSEMIEKYDYVNATQVAAKHGVGLGIGEGPILIAVGHGEKMVLDMSSFSNDDIYRAMKIWQNKICTDPKVWEPNLSLVQFREGFRSMLQSYGDQILKYFG